MPSFIISLVIGSLLLAADAPTGISGLAIGGDPPTIYRLVPAEPDRCAIVAYGHDPSGEAIARWDLAIDGRLLAVTRDASRACVLGFKPSTGRRRGDDSARAWTLMVVDLISGKTTGPMPLNLVPGAVTLLEQPGSDPRLLIGSTDRIAAYSLDPPRTSWHYESPGPNEAIAAGGAGVVAVLRGTTLGIIDPARRPRIEGRLQLGNDDVTSSIDLGTRGLAVAVSGDGAVAAVLGSDRRSVILIDVGAGKVMGTSTLGGPADSPLLGIVAQPDTGYRLMVASASPSPSMSIVEITAPEVPVAQVAPAQVEPNPAAEPSPPPLPPPPPSSEPDPEAPEADPNQTAEPGPPPPPASPEPEPEAPEADPNQTAEPGPEPPPPPPPPTPEPEQVRPSDEAFLTGKLTGETTAAKEVRFYGPNNILKLHARTMVAPDGTFRLALPPSGSYRVVITGDPGAHLFTRPEFRFVVVGQDGKGVSGIDFEVRGRL